MLLAGFVVEFLMSDCFVCLMNGLSLQINA